MHTPQTRKVPCFPPEFSKRPGSPGCSTLEKGNLFFTDFLDELFRPAKVDDRKPGDRERKREKKS